MSRSTDNRLPASVVREVAAGEACEVSDADGYVAGYVLLTADNGWEAWVLRGANTLFRIDMTLSGRDQAIQAVCVYRGLGGAKEPKEVDDV